MAIAVTSAPAGLDVVASRRGRHLFLHVVNTILTDPVRARFCVTGALIASGQVFESAQEPFDDIEDACSRLSAPASRALPASAIWEFPADAVSVVELRIGDARAGGERGHGWHAAILAPYRPRVPGYCAVHTRQATSSRMYRWASAT